MELVGGIRNLYSIQYRDQEDFQSLSRQVVDRLWWGNWKYRPHRNSDVSIIVGIPTHTLNILHGGIATAVSVILSNFGGEHFYRLVICLQPKARPGLADTLSIRPNKVTTYWYHDTHHKKPTLTGRDVCSSVNLREEVRAQSQNKEEQGRPLVWADDEECNP